MGTITWPQVETAEEAARKSPEGARARKRLKVSLPAHVRPFDPRFAQIEDVAQVMDFSRDGLYFTSCMPHYFLGMRLIVQFPFGDNISASRTFLATVVRIEELENASRGVALRFLL